MAIRSGGEFNQSTTAIHSRKMWGHDARASEEKKAMSLGPDFAGI